MTAPSQPLTLRRKWVVVAALGIIAVIGTITYFDTFSADARAARKFLREMPVGDIQEIRIEPYTVLSLTDQIIVIRDRAQIARIAEVFRTLQPYHPNHPSATWVGIIRFQLADREYGGQIESTNNQGALFYMASNVQGGWNYGSYRNDALAPFFTELMAAERKK